MEQVYKKYFNKAFTSHHAALKYVLAGRSPFKHGRPIATSFRMFAVSSGLSTEVHLYHDDHKLAVFHPDNTVEFTAPRKTIWSSCYSIAGNIHKIVPVYFHRINTGRYGLVTPYDVDTLNKNGVTVINRWHKRAMQMIDKQEYFQHLRLDLSTGKIVNPKDMAPVVDETKRKIWLDGMKAARLKLRAMARVGVFENRELSYRHYMTPEQIFHIADCIMAGALDEAAIDSIVSTVSHWKVRRFLSVGDAVVAAFETTVKSNSAEMRTHVGVLDKQS